MFVKAKDGIKVRDPITGLHIPEAGAEVPESTYWNRRISTGEVYLADAEAAPEQESPAAEKTEIKPSRKSGSTKKE